MLVSFGDWIPSDSSPYIMREMLMYGGYKKTGSGILSYMSAQAGANQVIALEASSMAEKIEIVTHNPPLYKHITA